MAEISSCGWWHARSTLFRQAVFRVHGVLAGSMKLRFVADGPSKGCEPSDALLGARQLL